MKLLLDTHILLWWLADDRRLPKPAKQALTETDNHAFVSVVSLWEIVIKTTSGKLALDLRELMASLKDGGYSVLPVHERHTLTLATLLPYHHDPFDRMLVAQAMSDSLRLLTHDRQLARYGESVFLV